MTTSAQFTTRARDTMFSIFQSYQSLQRQVQDLIDEVDANGGATGIYGPNGVNFNVEAQGDGFTYADMVAAFTNLTTLVGEPTEAEKQSIIKTRRD